MAARPLAPALVFVIALFPIAFLRPALLSAAGLQSRNEVRLEQAFNPRPAAGDIILPMPCGLSMVFVPVGVPARGFLQDVPLIMGTDGADRPGMEYYERRFAQGVSGPFRVADLPPAWRERLNAGNAADDAEERFYYFMGKYEVSTLQWRAVMEASCPVPPFTDDDIRPRTDISWYDAVEFSRRYNEWLVANAPDAIPRFENDPKNVGFVRLPSEAEWEYAARGGDRVPGDALRQNDFHPLEEGTDLEDYAVFRPEGAARIFEKPEPVGSRRPNPLGIHDMAGNVAEMMLEHFRFSLGNRLHGSAGGVLRKGGGFNASRPEILPGRREEMPPVHARGVRGARDTGLRLALSGINTPDGGRTDLLQKEWARLGEQDRGEQDRIIASGADPLREIDRILEITRDPTARTNLLTLRGVIKDANIALERERSVAAEGQVRSAAYMLETIRNYAVRLNISLDRIKRYSEENRKISDKTGVVYKKRAELIRGYEQAAQSCRDAMRASTLFYKDRLDDLVAVPDADYAHHMNLLRREFAGDALFNKNMSANLRTLDAHRALARTGKLHPLGVDALLREILPPTLREHAIQANTSARTGGQPAP